MNNSNFWNQLGNTGTQSTWMNANNANTPLTATLSDPNIPAASNTPVPSPCGCGDCSGDCPCKKKKPIIFFMGLVIGIGFTYLFTKKN